MLKKLLWLALLVSPLLCLAQSVSFVPAYPADRVEGLAKAIAHAEGFYQRGTIPARYHNPGDIKAVPGVKYPGQVRIGKGQHIVFRTDADGWAALRHQIDVILRGQSAHYTLDMTLNQVSRRYAANWRNWARYVGHVLGVPPSTTLRDYLCGGEIPTAIVQNSITLTLGD